MDRYGVSRPQSVWGSPLDNLTFDNQSGQLTNMGVPLSQASQTTTQQQVSNAPYTPQARGAAVGGEAKPNAGNAGGQLASRTGNKPGSGGSLGSSGAGGTPGVNSYDHSFINGSKEWYGGMNNYQAALAASSPEGFFSLYGGQGPGGWQPGGEAEAFMMQNYDPRALGAAMYGPGNYSSVEDMLAGQTAITNQLTGSRAGFINPGQVVGNVIQALSNGDVQALAKVNPLLAQIINGNAGNPAGQIQDLISFLGQALMGSMPGDVLDAWLSSLQRLGSQFINGMGGPIKNLDGKSFAQFLASQLGPTLGL